MASVNVRSVSAIRTYFVEGFRRGFRAAAFLGFSAAVSPSTVEGGTVGAFTGRW